MDFSHGILLFVIGCTVTFVCFFTAFLVINYNKKKELQRLKEIENRKKFPDHYFGDDTVWQKIIQKQIIGIEMLER